MSIFNGTIRLMVVSTDTLLFEEEIDPSYHSSKITLTPLSWCTTSRTPCIYQRIMAADLYLVQENDTLLGYTLTLEHAREVMDSLATTYEQGFDRRRYHVIRTTTENPPELTISTQKLGYVYNGAPRLRVKYNVKTLCSLSRSQLAVTPTATETTHINTIPDATW